ncbi:MAG TPA: hypothetical protein VEI98_05040 [Xanthobacteraceae bacterium]|nr:hypothetical protein [Xanthobacteraceae bacterium]
MQFTVTDELAVTAAAVSDVPGVEGKVSVAALMVQDAVIVIDTVKFAVAVPASATLGMVRHRQNRLVAAMIVRSKILNGRHL